MDQAPITYLVLAHDLPRQFGRLVRALGSRGSAVVTHVDAARDETPFRRALDDSSVTHRFLDRRTNVRWGDFSMVRVTLDLLRLAVTAHPAEHYVLLSGADFPVRPEAELRQTLRPGVSYINSWPMPDEARGKSMRRLEHHYVGFKRRGSRLGWLVNEQLLPRLPARRVAAGLEGLRPYGGSAWWALPDTVVRDVLDFADQHPRVVRFFSRSANPDEMFFQTIVEACQPSGERAIKPALTYADWSEGGPSPKILGKGDLGRLLEREEFFARKFDERVDPGVLTALEERLA